MPFLRGAAHRPVVQLPCDHLLPAATLGTGRSSLRVLVAEDHPVNQRLLLLLLEKMGHRPTICDNGETALDLLAKADFDLVLMDIHMPVRDGLSTIRALRQSEKGMHRMPVIALTADQVKGARERAFDAGADDFVAKPLEPADLYRAMARLFATMGDGRTRN